MPSDIVILNTAIELVAYFSSSARYAMASGPKCVGKVGMSVGAVTGTKAAFVSWPA